MQQEKRALYGYTQDELKAFYEAGKTIIGTYTNFYEITYSQAQKRCFVSKLNYHRLGFAKKGRHYVLTPKEANHILGEKVFNEEE